MIAALLPLASRLVGPRFARPLVYGALIAFALLALWGLKSCYDSNLIENARNAGNVEALEAKAEADAEAGRARARDRVRVHSESTELKEAVDEAIDEGRDPRAAYYECVRLQQQARTAGRPAPAC